jgi:hypothetical protein
MGKTAWLLLVPGLPALAFAWLHLFLPQSELTVPMGGVAGLLAVAFAAWGLLGKSEPEANRFGAVTA